jgi:DNA-binding NtrC family response regulator
MVDRKILIVDDEQAIRALLHAAVSSPGFTVFDADSGAKALAIADEQGPFDLVVSDVLMPGMDGITLASQLAARGRAARFLFVSGYCDIENEAERTRNFESYAFLGKPFSIPELLSSVRALLNEEPVRARTASIRQSSTGSALLRRSQPVDAARMLRRKARRVCARRDALVEDTRWELRIHAALVQQIQAQFAAIQSIPRRLPTRRAML